MGAYEKRAKDLVARMTLEEKLAQIGSCWIYELQTQGEMDWVKIAQRMEHGIGQVTRPAGASTHSPVAAAKFANQLQKYLIEETRLGIPAILHEECCLGALILGGSIFPQMLGLASTFQPEWAGRMADVARQQLMAVGARQGLAPVLDVAVDPRWGRIEETFGEDPLLVSHFGAAYIQGLQSETLSGGVMATGKHFVGHSISQGGLNCAPVHIGMREIYEIYLMPFQAAIREAKIASLMNSYPELDGEVVAASRRFLTDLLREELGFDGLLVSDYEAVNMLHDFHFVADSPARAAVLALKAGIEVELPTAVCYDDPLKTALERGEIGLEFVDRAVQRHLEKKFELGLFDAPYVDEGRVLEVFETPTQRSLAHEIAVRSMVLLKNDGVLPLPKTIGTLAVIGPNADSGRSQMGDYSYAAMSQLVAFQNPEGHGFTETNLAACEPCQVSVSSVLEAIRATVSKETEVLYAKGCENAGEVVSGIPGAVSTANKADVVVLVLGDLSGLTPECTTGETRDSASLRLPGQQARLAEAILATGKPVVVVLINGRPYAIPYLAEKADAILEAWLPGEEGGKAVAEVLFGEANPGGKLPITFPRSVGQIPLVYHAKPAGKRSHWYGDYTDEKVTPLFPFGHGLSYTTFKYSGLAIHPAQATLDEQVTVSIRVKNVGAVSGDEVVQLYTHQSYASVPRPSLELRGYQRVALKPGETYQVVFRLPVNQLAFYDNDLMLVLEPGEVDVLVGSSSADLRQTGAFEIVGAEKMAVGERVFFCPVSVEKLMDQ